jgi:phage tail sheath gpL-like
MIDGMYITSRKGTVGELSTFGSGRNSKHVICGHSEKICGWSAEFAGALSGKIAKEGQADPARPFQTLELVGILPPAVIDRFTTSENNSLLYDGISTFYVDSGGKVRIQRVISMYQTNELGAEDIAYLDANTLFTLMYLRYDFRTQINTKYPRAKLADDGVSFGPGQQVMTPNLGKSEAINIFRGWEQLGLVEGVDQFKQDLVCVRSSTDPNRLEWILPPDLINQFRVGAATIQFLLETPV